MIAISSDHGGYKLKVELMKHLEKRGIEYKDFGAGEGESVDYPIYARKAARAVASGECEAGIVVCTTGIGISIAANKVRGIRCAAVESEMSAEFCKRHNNANMIALGGGLVGPEKAKRMVDLWLDAEFEGDRHLRRVNQIMEIEKEDL